MRKLGSSPDSSWIRDFMTSPGFIGQDAAVLYIVHCHAKSGRSFWDESWEGSPNPLKN